jgi:putative tryptophan/tyrosine transport system substrate-binding protein
MRRREFITLVGGAATTWPLAARAQQPVIGFINAGSPDAFTPYVAAFRQGLGEVGYAEGRNIAIEFRWAEGKYDRLPVLAADLAQRQVAVIVVSGGAVSALAAKAATSTVPIVFVMGDDPIKTGVVPSLNRPGGNITGLTLFISTLMAKRFELLGELMPAKSRLALLVNPKNPNVETETNQIESAARDSGFGLQLLNASSDREIDASFATMIEGRISALLLGTDPFFYSRRDQFVKLAARHGIPGMYFVREFVTAGGLISYGPSFVGEWRQAGVYAGRILKGAKPVNLPVLQPTKFELVINLKTARTLAVAVPDKLLALADEVVE